MRKMPEVCDEVTFDAGIVVPTLRGEMFPAELIDTDEASRFALIEFQCRTSDGEVVRDSRWAPIRVLAR